MDPMIQLAHMLFEKRPEEEIAKYCDEHLIDPERSNEKIQA